MATSKEKDIGKKFLKEMVMLADDHQNTLAQIWESEEETKWYNIVKRFWEKTKIGLSVTETQTILSRKGLKYRTIDRSLRTDLFSSNHLQRYQVHKAPTISVLAIDTQKKVGFGKATVGGGDHEMQMNGTQEESFSVRDGSSIPISHEQENLRSPSCTSDRSNDMRSGA
jgi:hypothetical protein